MRDRPAVAAHAPHACVHRAVRAAPREHEQVGALLVVDLEIGHLDPRDLLRAQLRHQVVVLGVVRDVAGLVRLLEPADPMLEPGRARDRPRPRERLGVALVGQERLAVRGRELDVDRLERADVRDLPRLGAVREVRVREQVDRRAVGERDAHRLDRRVEAVARASRLRSPAPATPSCARRAPSAGRPAPASSASRSTARRAARR